MTTQQIQHLLAYLGYDVAPDGIPGTQTTAAVREFQKNYGGIDVDGDAGTQTQKALRDAVAYNKFRPPDSKTEDKPQTGIFWDGIKHFTRDECKCKCGGRYCNGYPAEMREEVMRIADAAREYFGVPAHVVSALRCQQHNANEGGVANSQHMYGEAMDIRVDGVGSEKLYQFIIKQPGVRYAYKINSTNVHFDIPKGAR